MDEALFAAHDRLSMMLSNLPSVRVKLRAAGAELHIIGRDQVTTDLPEWRHDKGKPLDEYHGLTRDQRTRGMGGLLTSCGEENLLKLEKDRYRGRDICVHEFAHNILGHGVSREVRQKVREQYRRSLDHGLWVGSYAGSNFDEFFAELTMWYFGTHGDLGMKGAKPANGRDGLKAYDPEAFALLDDFYSGRMEPAVQTSPPRTQSKLTSNMNMNRTQTIHRICIRPGHPGCGRCCCRRGSQSARVPRLPARTSRSSPPPPPRSSPATRPSPRSTTAPRRQTRTTRATAPMATGRAPAPNGCNTTGASRSPPAKSMSIGSTTTAVFACPRPAG